MCRAISILKNRINLELIEEYNLRSRARQRSDAAQKKAIPLAILPDCCSKYVWYVSD